MAEVGRVRRARKVIDYASFADGDESDDDFVSLSTPPVAKKPKLDKPEKSKAKPKKEKNEKENVKKKEKKSLNRKPPGEDFFDRELQAALELSMVETSSQETETESQENETDIKPVVKASKPVIIDDDEDEIVCLGSEPIKSSSPDKLSRRAAVKAAEQKQAFLQDSESDGPSQEKNDDEDFKVEDDGESEDDSNGEESEDSFNPDDDDSDFDDGKKKKGQAKKPTAKTTDEKTPQPVKKPAPKKQSKAVTSTPSNAKTIKSTGKSIPKPAAEQFRSPLASNSLPTTTTPKPNIATGISRKPAWTPPALSGLAGKPVNLGGVSLKSPSGGGGGLRLGLSRNVRLKPLHSSVKEAR